jgi:fumarate reductase subunit C
MKNHSYIYYLPLSLAAIATFVASVLVPFIGNPIITILITASLFAVMGTSHWLIYLPISIALGQISMLMSRGIVLSDGNAICAVVSLLAWAVGICIGHIYKKKHLHTFR